MQAQSSTLPVFTDPRSSGANSAADLQRLPVFQNYLITDPGKSFQIHGGALAATVDYLNALIHRLKPNEAQTLPVSIGRGKSVPWEPMPHSCSHEQFVSKDKSDTARYFGVRNTDSGEQLKLEIKGDKAQAEWSAFKFPSQVRIALDHNNHKVWDPKLTKITFMPKPVELVQLVHDGEVERAHQYMMAMANDLANLLSGSKFLPIDSKKKRTPIPGIQVQRDHSSSDQVHEKWLMTFTDTGSRRSKPTIALSLNKDKQPESMEIIFNDAIVMMERPRGAGDASLQECAKITYSTPGQHPPELALNTTIVDKRKSADIAPAILKFQQPEQRDKAA